MNFCRLFFILLILPSIVFSQSSYTNVMISSQNSPNEVSICINPKNTNQLVGGANIDNYYYSSNSGNTWTRGQLTSSYTVWGDPCVIIDTTGNYYFFHLTNPSGNFIDRIVCQKSTNAGMNWSNGSYTGLNLPKMQDKAWGCVDFTHGSRGNWMYVTWTQFDTYGSSNTNDSSHILFSRSTDAGLTWTTALRLDKQGGDCIDQDYTVEGAVPCIGPNGELYVGWAGAQSVNNFKLFFDKSTDGGTTWLANDIIAGTQRAGWDLGSPNNIGVAGIYRANGLPITLCDISNSTYRGTIYINYVDSAGNHDRDVMLIKSTDGGNTWSAPIRVNDDAAGREQFFTWMTIDQTTGYLYCVFYDRRNYTNTTTDVYMAYSTNGGTAWVNQRISASPFTPTNTFIFFGDYNGITAYNGKVRPMWTRLESGVLSVWTAIIDDPVGITPIQTEIPQSYSLEQNYPNPFNPTTTFRFGLPKEDFVSIKVYDVLGKEAAIIVNEKLTAGTYEYHWDASGLSSGVYFYEMTTGNNIFKNTKRLVLTK